MGVTLNLYKNKIKRIVRDILVENQLHELFDSPPFQTSFNFGENSQRREPMPVQYNPGYVPQYSEFEQWKGRNIPEYEMRHNPIPLKYR